MNTESIILLMTAAISLFTILFTQYRLNWLHKERLRIMDEDFNHFKANGYTGVMLPRFDKLQPYLNKHLLQFWVWDINKWL